MSPAEPSRIETIAAELGLSPTEFEPYGWYKAKLAPGYVPPPRRARYVGVSAVTPTPLGEGKTVVTIGLSMALCRAGHKAVATLREPSRAPVFGIKGGGAGGGRSMLLPMEDINLHFTGDLPAVSAANNLLAAMVDNHVARNRTPRLDAEGISWRRVVDVSDRGLSQITTGSGGRKLALRRETGFDLTAASEVMAILALARDMADLRARLGLIIVGLSPSGDPVTAEDIGAAGSMAALLRDALRPNLAQTSEHTPAFVHTGPFANIAHGNSSVLADLAAVGLADFVVTESGFGADCGAEKLFHIKCRASGITPDVEVLVCSARAIKLHSGRFDVHPGKPLPDALLAEDLDALRAGAVNLEAHLDHLRAFGLPVVVAVNRFPTDHEAELDELCRLAREAGASQAVVCDVYARGGEGGEELADAVASAKPASFRELYPLDAPLEDKLRILATRIYGADDIDLSPGASKALARLTKLGFGALPVCVAKTQYSLSHDPKLSGRPRGYRFPIREVRLSAGAGFVYALTNNIRTMPGLPGTPAALGIDVDESGAITGLF